MADDFNIVEYDSQTLYDTTLLGLMRYCEEALYPGDERRIFGEAMVAVLVATFGLFNDRAKQRTLQFARGVVLDALGERQDVIRLQPSYASAIFRFEASAAIDENIIIPKGTRITADGNVYFATSEIAILSAGQTVIDLEAVCTEGGAKHNGYAVGSITTLVDLIPYLKGASNITESDGGDDGEPYTTEGDNRFRERIRLAPASQSTAGPEIGYRYWAMSADPDISDVAIDCPEDKPNTVNIYPLMTGGKIPDEETLQKVLEAVNDEKRRPMTDFVQALPPEQVDFTIELTYYCKQDDEAATIEALEAEGGAIDQYIKWQTSTLARDINPDQLRRFLLAPSSGVGAYRVDIVSPSYTELSKMQVANLADAPIVTHEVIEG